jgi:hypothetical protein
MRRQRGGPGSCWPGWPPTGFQLAVVGQFSRGKTTLMNALLGGAYLPMGALPMTSVITTVRYGGQPRAMVRRRPGPVQVITLTGAYLDALRRLVGLPRAQSALRLIHAFRMAGQEPVPL